MKDQSDDPMHHQRRKKKKKKKKKKRNSKRYLTIILYITYIQQILLKICYNCLKTHTDNASEDNKYMHISITLVFKE